MQHVAAADRVAGDHRDDRLRQPPDLDVQVGDVEASDRLVLAGLVVAPYVAAVAAADALVAARAERLGALAGQDDDADCEVLARTRRTRPRAR